MDEVKAKTNTLLTIQSVLKAPKNQHNSFGNYDYRSAEDILNALKPILKAYNSTLTLSDLPVLIGDWHYIKTTATLKTPDGEYTVTAYARESETKKGMDSSQITGTASSYARKYALNGLFLIDDTKDSDTNEYQSQTRQNTSKTEKAQQPKMNNNANSLLKSKKQLIGVYIQKIANEMGLGKDAATKKQIQSEALAQAAKNPHWEEASSLEKANLTATILQKRAESYKK